MQMAGGAPLKIEPVGDSTAALTASPGGRRSFRPAWAKDGGAFGTPKAADGGGAVEDFEQLSLAGPGGPRATQNSGAGR